MTSPIITLDLETLLHTGVAHNVRLFIEYNTLISNFYLFVPVNFHKSVTTGQFNDIKKRREKLIHRQFTEVTWRLNETVYTVQLK